MLSDEEKEAIEYLKQNSIAKLRYDNFGNILTPLYHGTFEKEIILNLIEKQSKEIEELKEINEEMGKALDEWNNGERTSIFHIHKDKIKAKIEKWDKDIKWNNADDHYYAIKMMQSLLEKE